MQKIFNTPALIKDYLPAPASEVMNVPMRASAERRTSVFAERNYF
jgi:hypothetical protein